MDSVSTHPQRYPTLSRTKPSDPSLRVLGRRTSRRCTKLTRRRMRFNATQQPQRVPPGIPPHLVGMPPQVIRAYLRDQRDKTRDEATSTSPQPTAQIHVPTQQPHRDSSGPHGQESNSSEDWSRKRTYPYADYQTSTAKRPRLKSALIQLG